MRLARPVLQLTTAIGFILLGIGMSACSRSGPEVAAVTAPTGKADVDGERIANADSEPGS